MEFKLTPVNTDDSINYNYYETKFYSNQYEKTYENGGYIKIPYASKSNQMNISSDIFDADYVTTNLYIIKKIHEIEDVEFDGELIIEHKPLTNNEKPLYTCFLLTNNTDAVTTIDKLITGNKNITLELNDYIEPSKIIYYNSNEHVIIFTKPISISSNIDDFKPHQVCSPYNKEYNIFNINLENIQEGFVENATDMTQIATYCQLIDETDPTIVETPNVLVPLNGEGASNMAENTLMQTTLTFTGFFVVLLVIVFFTPTLYKVAIINIVLNKRDEILEIDIQKVLNRLSAINYYVGIILFTLAFTFITLGIKNNDSIFSIYGIFILMAFIAVTIVLQYKQSYNISDFFKELLYTSSKPTEEDKIGDYQQKLNAVQPDIFSFLGDNINALMYTYIKENGEEKKQLNWKNGSFIAVTILLLLLLYFLYSPSKHIISALYPYILLVVVYFLIVRKYFMDE